MGPCILSPCIPHVFLSFIVVRIVPILFLLYIHLRIEWLRFGQYFCEYIYTIDSFDFSFSFMCILRNINVFPISHSLPMCGFEWRVFLDRMEGLWVINLILFYFSHVSSYDIFVELCF